MKKKEKQPASDVVKVKLDPINEAVIIVAVVVDEKARKRYIEIPADYFFGAGHAEMWIALQELFRRGLEFDVETLRSIAGETFKVDILAEYLETYKTAPVNLKHHVEKLRWHRARHDAAKGPVAAFVDMLRDPQADPESLMTLAHQIPDCFKGTGGLRYLRTVRTVKLEHSRELTERREGKAIYPYGIEGFDTYGEDDYETKMVTEGGVKREERKHLKGLPRMVPGAYPGQTTVITGLSGSGKTTVMAVIVLALIAQKRKVLWGAWEQTSGLSLELAAVISLGMSRTDVMSGRFDAEDQRTLEEEMDRLDPYLQFFELPAGAQRGEKQNFFNDRNLDTIHQYIAESGCDVFIGDVFKYALYETRPDEEDRALKRMKAISIKTKTHNFLIQHLNLKDVERRPDKRPTRDAVMGTGGWINVGDTVIGVHCRSLYEPVPNDKIELHVLKQRHGRWPQVVECDWDPEFGYIGHGVTAAIALPGEKSDLDEFVETDITRQGKRGTKRGGTRQRW